MDQFGVGVLLKMAMAMYTQCSRQTGRTVHLVNSAKDGDIICFVTRSDADNVQRLCDERGIRVECIVVDPRQPHRVLEYTNRRGRILFDHTWIEDYYTTVIEQASSGLDELQRRVSGCTDKQVEPLYRAKHVPFMW